MNVFQTSVLLEAVKALPRALGLLPICHLGASATFEASEVHLHLRDLFREAPLLAGLVLLLGEIELFTATNSATR